MERGAGGVYAIVRQEWKLSYLPFPRYLSESGNRKILTLYADAFSLHVLKPGAQSRSTISAPPRCLTESRFGYSARRAPSPPGYDDNRNWKYICFFCFKRNPLNINFFSFFFFLHHRAAELLATRSGKSRVYHRGASVAAAGGID